MICTSFFTKPRGFLLKTALTRNTGNYWKVLVVGFEVVVLAFVLTEVFVEEFAYSDVVFGFIQRRSSGIVLDVDAGPLVEQEIDDVVVSRGNREVKRSLKSKCQCSDRVTTFPAS